MIGDLFRLFSSEESKVVKGIMHIAIAYHTYMRAHENMKKIENVKKNIEKLDFVTGFATSQRGNGDTHLKCFSPI